MSWADAIHPDDLEQTRLMTARQLQGEVVDSEYPYEHQTGMRNGYEAAPLPSATRREN